MSVVKVFGSVYNWKAVESKPFLKKGMWLYFAWLFCYSAAQQRAASAQTLPPPTPHRFCSVLLTHKPLISPSQPVVSNSPPTFHLWSSVAPGPSPQGSWRRNDRWTAGYSYPRLCWWHFWIHFKTTMESITYEIISCLEVQEFYQQKCQTSSNQIIYT